MGRPRKGWQWRPQRHSKEPRRIRFSIDGRQVERSTGLVEREAATAEAERIYADAVRAKAPKPAKRRPAQERQPSLDVSSAAALWLNAERSLRDTTTTETYALYAEAHWQPHFGDVSQLQDGVRSYVAARLERVKAVTLSKELGALGAFGRWLHAEGLLSAPLEIPKLPPKATGTPARTHVATDLTPLEVRQLQRRLPRWAKPFRDRHGILHGRWPMRAFFVVAYETALRPATLHALTIGVHYTHGAKWFRIPLEDDKARHGRRVPLTLLARLALEAVTRGLKEGELIFPPRMTRKALKGAARRAGIDDDRVATLHRYDLRGLRATHLLGNGAELDGVQALLDHKSVATTAHYIRRTERAAEKAVLGARRRRP